MLRDQQQAGWWRYGDTDGWVLLTGPGLRPVVTLLHFVGHGVAWRVLLVLSEGRSLPRVRSGGHRSRTYCCGLLGYMCSLRSGRPVEVHIATCTWCLVLLRGHPWHSHSSALWKERGAWGVKCHSGSLQVIDWGMEAWGWMLTMFLLQSRNFSEHI